MDQTARFALPFLAPGQAQKEWFHNEALQRIDLLLCAAVMVPPMSNPPANPAVGDCYIVGDGGTSDWAGEEGTMAGFSEGGWRFVEPPDGMRVLVLSTGETMVRSNGSWEAGIVRASEIRVGDQAVVRTRQPAIANASGGATVDAESRAAIAGILSALRAHGLVEI